MDALTLTITGHVGSKIRGLYLDGYKRDCYGFSMCCNYKHGRDESQLWANVMVREPGLLQLCLERGLYQGEKIMIASTEVTQAAAIVNGQARAYLNVMACQLVFLTQVYPDAIVNVSGGTPRIIDYDQLMKVG